jgi:lipopolysaccharide export LptBFGC system permease protein LptF
VIKRIFLALPLLLFCGLTVFFALAVSGNAAVWAQTTPVEVMAQPADVDAERAAIEAERARLDQIFAIQNRSCYEKFLVNRCLNAFKVQHRESMSDLKRRDNAINDQERQLKGEQERAKIAERTSPEAVQAAADKRAASMKEFDDRMAREKENFSAQSGNALNAKKFLAEQADRIDKNKAKLAARSVRQAEATEQSIKYQDRLAQAKERQEANAKRQQDSKPAAASLPTPP